MPIAWITRPTNLSRKKRKALNDLLMQDEDDFFWKEIHSSVDKVFVRFYYNDNGRKVFLGNFDIGAIDKLVVERNKIYKRYGMSEQPRRYTGSVQGSPAHNGAPFVYYSE